MSTLLSLLAACTGASGPSDDASATDAGAAADPPAEVHCTDGAKVHETSTGAGTEVFCDRDGVMHGEYLRRHPNGQRAAKGQYTNSEPDGDWTWWHDNGEESQKGKYTKGKQVGAWTRWHPNGMRAEEGDYLSGRKAGTWNSFYESGHKKDTGIYHNDMKNGVWTYYFDDDENTIEKTELWEGGAMKTETIVNKEPPKPGEDKDAKAKGKKGG